MPTTTNPIVQLTDSQVARGEVLDEGELSYLIEAGNGIVEHVPKQGRYELLVETDAFEMLFDQGGEVEFEPMVPGGKTVSVSFSVTEDEKNYVLSVGDSPIAITGEDLEPTLKSLKADLQARDSIQLGSEPEDAGIELYYQYQELIEGTVRKNIIDAFADNIDNVEVTDAGWIVADTFLVDYEAQNHYLDEVDTYVVNGHDVVATEDAHEALDLDADVPDGGTTVTTQDGTEVDLSETETRFLSTVDFLLNAEDRLPENIASELINAKFTRVVSDPFDEGITEISEGMTETGFKDSYSGIVHGARATHRIDKHTLPDRLSVTDRALSKLHSNWWDHLGVHELRMREEEFRNADYAVFEDTHNNDEHRWNKIYDTAENAPVNQHQIAKLENDIDEQL